MLVRVDDIGNEGMVLDFEEPHSAFPSLNEISETGACRFLLPIKIHLRLLRAGEMVEVEGEAETLVRLNCSRCLKEFETPVATSFALTFTRELPEVAEESGEKEIEVSAEEMGLILFQGEEIDLRDAVQEQLLLALPYRPLCDEACRGLCPQCGTDLNEQACGCKAPVFNSKFGALKNFKAEKK